VKAADFADKTIAVLAGGESGEREVSLRTGQGILDALTRQGFPAVMVDPDPRRLAEQLQAADAEVVFNALHGGIGEDGRLQALLEMLGYPYTGSGVLGSALSMNKLASKRIMTALAVESPSYRYLQAPYRPAMLAQVLDEIGLPAVTKPVSDGSSLNITICREEATLERELQALLGLYGDLLVDVCIEGIELTVGVLGCGETLRALPVLEIAPHKEFYDYEAKYTKGLTDLICPARISEEATRRAQALAVTAHQALYCHGISRCDMHLDAQGRLWFHEVNSCPGMTETSDVPHEASGAGITYDDVVLEILASAGAPRP
jgi:D-alanine-D-alanine ligase